MVKLTQPERERLIALLGMLGSEHDGEVVNAARLALKFLKDRQLTWESVLNVKGNIFEDIGINTSGFKTSSAEMEHTDMCDAILSSGIRLSPKEAAFVDDMLTWRYPTDKQMEWLKKIYHRTQSRKW